MEQTSIFDYVEYHYKPPLTFNRPVKVFAAILKNLIEVV